MDINLDVIAKATERWNKNATRRNAITKKLKDGKVADDEARVQKRLKHLSQTATILALSHVTRQDLLPGEKVLSR